MMFRMISMENHQKTLMSLLLLLSLLQPSASSSSSSLSALPCYLCRPGDKSVPNPNSLVGDWFQSESQAQVVPIKGKNQAMVITSSTTCLDVAMEGLLLSQEGSQECIEYYRFIGYTKCGCEGFRNEEEEEPPIEINSQEMQAGQCNLCPMGKTLSSSEEDFDGSTVRGVSCAQTQQFLFDYNIGVQDEVCSSFQRLSSCSCTPIVDDTKYKAASNNADDETNGEENEMKFNWMYTIYFCIGFGCLALLFSIHHGRIMRKRRNGLLSSMYIDGDDDANDNDHNVKQSFSLRKVKKVSDHDARIAIFRQNNYNEVKDDQDCERHRKKEINGIVIEKTDSILSEVTFASSQVDDSLFKMEEAQRVRKDDVSFPISLQK